MSKKKTPPTHSADVPLGVVAVIVVVTSLCLSCGTFDCERQRLGILVYRVSGTDQYDHAKDLVESARELYEEERHAEAAELFLVAAAEYAEEVELADDDLALVRKNRMSCYKWARLCFLCVGERESAKLVDREMTAFRNGLGPGFDPDAP